MRFLSLLLLFACNGSTPDTGPALDTGWFTEPVDPECTDTVLRTFPAADTDDWYWQSPPVVQVATDDREDYTAVLLNDLGDVVPTTPVWTGTQLTLALAESLAPNTDYLLRTTDCLGRREAPFRTSDFGTALEMDAGVLVGRTYAFDIGGARWEQPPGIGALMNLYFSDPILIGVEWSSDTVIDLLGGQGFFPNSGQVAQFPGQPTWDFPVADFTQAPFFRATAPSIEIEFDDVALIIYDFQLTATVSADGETMGGGWISGLGDTRHLGPVLNQGDDPAAACRITEGLGSPCIACPDGEPYCLTMSARDADGVYVRGLRLERQDG